MNNKIVKTKKINAIFLATVLIAGTIAALSFPSFMIAGTAQAQAYYDGMDSYGPPEYPDNNYYNSYEQDYGMDSYEKKSYRNDYYEEPREYPSYKEEYKPEYPSYSKDFYKSTKDSDIINKIKCTTNNINVNGDITGDVNLGNKGQGDLGAYSSNGDGYGREGYYYDDYNNNKKDKGFECIINNNNNNIAGIGGNVTDGGNLTKTCEECFAENLTPEELASTKQFLATTGLEVQIGGTITTVHSLEELCALFPTTSEIIEIFVSLSNLVGETRGVDIFLCLSEALGFDTSGLQ